DLAGSAGGGFIGVSASIDVLTVKNATSAYIGLGVSVSAGRDVVVRAVETRDIESTVVGFGVGAGSLQGSVAVVDIGSAITTEADGLSEDTKAKVNEQLTGSLGSKVGDVVGNNPTALQVKSAADTQTGGLNVNDAFDPGAATAKGTSAAVRGSVSAGQ